MAVMKCCVVILFVVISFSDVTNAQLDWRQWLTEQRQRQQQEQQEVEQPPAEPQEQPESSGLLRNKLEELRRRQQLEEMRAEREQAQREEMEDMLGNYELEELALQLGTDTLGRILRPLREQPTVSPIDDCTHREWPVEFEFGITGSIKYDVCGSGDDAALRVRFMLPGQTTPAMDTTTPIETTTEQRVTCPTFPTTPEKPATTTGKPTTTQKPTTAPPTTTPQETTEAKEDTTPASDETTPVA